MDHHLYRAYQTFGVPENVIVEQLALSPVHFRHVNVAEMNVALAPATPYLGLSFAIRYSHKFSYTQRLCKAYSTYNVNRWALVAHIYLGS
jgi:hypothetical protein